MKRKLKIAGLSMLLVTIFSFVVNSAVSGGVGFGILVLISYFAAVLGVLGCFVLLMMMYKLQKANQPVQTPKKKMKKKPVAIELDAPEESEENEEV